MSGTNTTLTTSTAPVTSTTSVQSSADLHKQIKTTIHAMIKKIEKRIEDEYKSKTDENSKKEKEKLTSELVMLKNRLNCIEPLEPGNRDISQFIQAPNDTLIQVLYDKKTHGSMGVQI